MWLLEVFSVIGKELAPVFAASVWFVLRRVESSQEISRNADNNHQQTRWMNTSIITAALYHPLLASERR